MNDDQAQMSEYDEDDVIIDDYSCFDNVASTKESTTCHQSDEAQSNNDKAQYNNDKETKSEENQIKGKYKYFFKLIF